METLRELTVDDVPACLALAADRGWSREEGKWRLLLRVGTGFGLFDGDELVGTTIVTPFGAEHAAVSMVLVASRSGGRGLGRRLVEHALEVTSAPVVSLHATEFGRPLYERLGFRSVGRVTAHFGVFAGVRPGVSRPAGEADRARVVAQDAAAFGADRSALWSALWEFASQVRVVPEGHAVSWREGEVETVGVVAPSVGVARDLVADMSPDVTVRVDVAEPKLGGWLAEHGVVPRHTVDLMVRGAAELPGDRGRLFSPVMQALG
ncbi:GNAT superfamily N-acetyltransferase [Saccharothrix coeruleofusca]|uniref:GNAT family N-acetyltransferase n=1 Tax=Saccharothrix coeruleofusca TaxID=33919 RepID=UPI0027DD55F1|nr:GNAT family N-acetyltransferase [Saccharothrix coeruleofusca]MBP2334264.1 GNAT superfamily N-acetyltransferase [Saccharothrix coeruleofusca]